MSWFRVRKALGGYCALFALALQLVLAFGHIHPREIWGSPGSTTTLATAFLKGGHGNSVSPGGQPAGDQDGYCDICATISMVGTGQAATPPQLPLPSLFEPVRFTAEHDQAAFDRGHVHFQSRAPPIV